MIGSGGKRGSGISMLMVRHDDDDITEISSNLQIGFKPTHQKNEINKNTWKENPTNIRFE